MTWRAEANGLPKRPAAPDMIPILVEIGPVEIGPVEIAPVEIGPVETGVDAFGQRICRIGAPCQKLVASSLSGSKPLFVRELP